MKMPTKRFFRLVVAIAGFALLLAAILAGLGSIPASRGYSIRAKFAELPADDRELELWLGDQPGVVRHTIHVKRDGQVVYVSWIMTQTVAGHPRTPDMRIAWQRMEYSKLKDIDWAWRDK